jgi:autotransporter translocation and assembly factor TamB
MDPALDGRLAFGEGAVDVWIDLAGTLREPELELTSDPPMAAADIARVVAVGEGGVGAEGGLSGAVLSGALSFVAGSVGEALAANLPVDVLSFELGPGGEVQRLEAGTYVTPRLFVSVVRRLLAEPDENRHEVQAEYELRRRVTLSTRYGDRQSGGVDLLYERRFASPEQRAASDERRRAEARAGAQLEGGTER